MTQSDLFIAQVKSKFWLGMHVNNVDTHSNEYPQLAYAFKREFDWNLYLVELRYCTDLVQQRHEKYCASHLAYCKTEYKSLSVCSDVFRLISFVNVDKFNTVTLGYNMYANQQIIIMVQSTNPFSKFAT